MFIHGGFWHILFNMIVLYFFGPRVEERLGSNRFITLYLISGLSGALFSVFTPEVAILGASAAVFGVELAYARFWPLDRVYIYGVLPIQMRWLVVLTVVMSIFGLGGFEPGIAHLAHLGGLVGAAIYLYVISRSRVRPKKSGPVRAEVRQPRAAARRRHEALGHDPARRAARDQPPRSRSPARQDQPEGDQQPHTLGARRARPVQQTEELARRHAPHVRENRIRANRPPQKIRDDVRRGLR